MALHQPGVEKNGHGYTVITSWAQNLCICDKVISNPGATQVECFAYGSNDYNPDEILKYKNSYHSNRRYDIWLYTVYADPIFF